MEVLQDTYKDTKIGRIPKNWEVLKLGDIFTFKNGLNKAKEFFGYGIPIVNYMDVYSNEGVYLKDLKGRVHLTSNEIDRFNIKKGDVFFTRTSETKEEIGYATVLLEDIKDGVFSGFVLRARSESNKLNLLFKKYCFSSNIARKQIYATSTISTRALTNGGSLSLVTIPLPPLPEQQKIAAILSTVDEQISTIDKIIEKSKELKKGLMQKLFSEGIGHTEFKDTKVGRIPKDWEVKSLEEVGLIKVGRDLNKEIYNPTLSKEHKVRVYSNAITDRGLYGFYSRSEYPKNSITITGRGDIGYAFARNEEFGAIGRLIVIHPNSNVDYIYLTNYINHSVNFHIETSGIPQLTGVQASKYKVAIPPLPEQQKIAAILSEADAKIEKEQIQKAQLQALKKGLMQQLLTGKKRVNV